jgi:hypothetical protein
MAMLALPLLIGSTAMSAVGSIMQGNAQASQYEAQAAAANYNAGLARQEAQAVGAQTAREEERVRRAGRSAVAEQYTATAQSGVAPQSGSAALSINEAATMAELDALNVRYRGGMQARGLRNEASLQDFSASTKRSAAKSAQTAGYIGAGTAILSGASKYASGSYKSPVSLNG